MKKLRNILFALALLLLLPLAARAAGSNSLTLILKAGEKPVSGVSFRIYQVEDSFSDPQSAYRALLTGNYKPTATKQTDANGVAVFEGLPDGTYLLLGEAAPFGDKLLRPEMSLIRLPAKEGADLTVAPKYSLTEKDKRVPYRLVKIWEGDFPSDRPREIRINLYRNEVFTKTVTLSAENNWRYEWTEEDPSALYVAVEQDVAGYTPSYETEGDTLYVINTPAEEEPTQPDSTTPTDKPSGPSLPQTGQLRWPVPVLALTGLVLLALGWMRRKENMDAK